MAVQVRLEAPGWARPGADATVVANVLNDSEVVEIYHIDILGELAAWAVTEPGSLKLMPRVEGSMAITFTVPPAELVPSGPVAWALRVQAASDPSICAVEESELSIEGVSVLACDLRPETARGRRRSCHQAVIENRGNKPADVMVTGQDKDEVLEVRVEHRRFTLEARGRKEVGIRVSSSDRGRAHHPFTIHVAEADRPAIELRGALDQRPLPKAVWRAPIILAALVLVLLVVRGPGAAKSIRLSSDPDEPATVGTTSLGSSDPSGATPTTAAPGAAPPSAPPEGTVAANPQVGPGPAGPAAPVGASPPGGGGAAAPNPTAAISPPTTVAPARQWRSSDINIATNPSPATSPVWSLLRSPPGGSNGALLSARADNVDDYRTVWCVAGPCPNRTTGNLENLPMIGVHASGLLAAHPDNDEDAVLRWRSPFTGTVNVTADARIDTPGGGGIGWALRSDGATLVSGVAGTAAVPGGSGASRRIAVSVGQTVDLAISPHGDRSGDTTVIGLTILEVK